MKLLAPITLALLLSSTAFGSSEFAAVYTTSINLNSGGGVVLDWTSTPGYLMAIACRVTTAVTGTSASTQLSVSLDSGGPATYNLYSAYGTTWHTDVSPYAFGTNGGNVGDYFVIQFPHLQWSSSGNVTVAASPGGTGVLLCSALFSIVE